MRMPWTKPAAKFNGWIFNGSHCRWLIDIETPKKFFLAKSVLQESPWSLGTQPFSVMRCPRDGHLQSKLGIFWTSGVNLKENKFKNIHDIKQIEFHFCNFGCSNLRPDFDLNRFACRARSLHFLNNCWQKTFLSV